MIKFANMSNRDRLNLIVIQKYIVHVSAGFTTPLLAVRTSTVAAAIKKEQ